MKKNKTIFVVEDSTILSEIIAMQLKRKFNCNVFTFEDGDDLRNQTKKRKPDLIVLDYNFGTNILLYSNGLAVLREFRRTFKIPVIVFSGQRDKEKALEIINAGAIDYISKDDDDFMENLLTSIEDVFKVQSSKAIIQRIKSKLKSIFIYLILLILIGVSVFVFYKFFFS